MYTAEKSLGSSPDVEMSAKRRKTVPTNGVMLSASGAGVSNGTDVNSFTEIVS